MVEAGANEVSEEQVVEALEFAHKAIQPAIKLQQELAQKVGVTPQEYTLLLPDSDIQQRVGTWLSGKMGSGLRMAYPERNDLVNQLREAMHSHFAEDIGEEAYAEDRGTTKMPLCWRYTRMYVMASSRKMSAPMAVN